MDRRRAPSGCDGGQIVTRDDLVMEARRLEYAGADHKERNLARMVNEWHFELERLPDSPGFKRLLNCALMDLRDHLTKEPA